MNQVESIDKIDRSPKYTPIENILALREKNLTMDQIGQLLGISKQAVSRRLKDYQPTFERIENFKKHRADILTLKQTELLSAIDATAIKEMAPRDRVIAFGVLYDKERLERGQSTSNIQSLSVLVERLDAQDTGTSNTGSNTASTPSAQAIDIVK